MNLHDTWQVMMNLHDTWKVMMNMHDIETKDISNVFFDTISKISNKSNSRRKSQHLNMVCNPCSHTSDNVVVSAIPSRVNYEVPLYISIGIIRVYLQRTPFEGLSCTSSFCQQNKVIGYGLQDVYLFWCFFCRGPLLPPTPPHF